MNGVNVVAFAAAAAGIAMAVLFYYISRKWTRRMRGMALSAAVVLSLPSILIGAYYLGLPLEYAWYYEMRSWRGSEFLILAAGAATGILMGFLPRALIAFPLFGLLALATVPYLKPVVMPLADADFHEMWQDGASLQSTASTCGAASVTTLLHRLGGNATEKDAARAAHSYQNGTEAWYLARYVRSRGFRARFDFRETFSPDVGFPAVVGVKLGSIGHFIPVLARDGDDLLIADPLQGPERLSMKELQRRYGFTGFHMPVSAR